jgi:hypothetical protein
MTVAAKKTELVKSDRNVSYIIDDNESTPFNATKQLSDAIAITIVILIVIIKYITNMAAKEVGLTPESPTLEAKNTLIKANLLRNVRLRAALPSLHFWILT